MRRKLTKKHIMKYYFSDEELKEMGRMSIKSTLRWLEEARKFLGKFTPKKVKKLQELLIQEGW